MDFTEPKFFDGITQYGIVGSDDILGDPTNASEKNNTLSSETQNQIQDYVDGLVTSTEKFNLLDSGIDRSIDIEELENNSSSQFQGDSLLGKGSGNGTQDVLVGDFSKDNVDPLTGMGGKKESIGPEGIKEKDFSKNSSSGSKFYVSMNGSDDNPGTLSKPWKTIDHAVSEDSPVKAGDTVLVQPGTYTELITLGKSGESGDGKDITLKADGDVTLKDPDPTKGGFREGVIQSAGKSHWVIDGFRIEDTSWAGISLRDASDITVQNNHTYQTGASGIIVLPDTYYEGGEKEVVNKDIKILNNTVERANWRWTGKGDPNGTQEAISVWGVDGFEVANNTVDQGNREGIDAKTGSRNGSIHNNRGDCAKTGKLYAKELMQRLKALYR